jgi:hypothetical protein
MNRKTFVSADQIALQVGTTKNGLIGKYYTSNEVPACCSHGCMVKPDDICAHGNVSVLAELKLA